jgi:cobalt/nickel transport system permease protein
LFELYQHHISPIHALDARVKIIFTLVLILTTSFLPSGAWMAYVLFLTIILSIISLSRIGLVHVQKRAVLVLFFVLSALPLIFLGPSPILSFSLFGKLIIPVSLKGLERFISIAIKAWISSQAAIILASTTPFSELLNGFRQLRIPGIIIAIIELMWRYLFLMVDEAGTMIRARNSRSSKRPDKRNSGGLVYWRASVTGGMAGSLFLRSIERSERVYAAMLSRGFTGEPLEIQAKGFGKREWVITLFAFFVFFLILVSSFVFGA